MFKNADFRLRWVLWFSMEFLLLGEDVPSGETSLTEMREKRRLCSQSVYITRFSLPYYYWDLSEAEK